MKDYLICVTKIVDKFIAVRAKNKKDSREKALKKIVNGEIDFNNESDDEVHYELSEIYSDSLEKKLREDVGKKAEEKNKKFAELTAKMIEADKKEQIEIHCKECGKTMLLDEIIHQ